VPFAFVSARLTGCLAGFEHRSDDVGGRYVKADYGQAGTVPGRTAASEIGRTPRATTAPTGVSAPRARLHLTRSSKRSAGLVRAVLQKIAEMQESDRAIAERLHAIIKASAPELSPQTWYGMPAYAKDGKVVCFFQSSHKFKTRYSTFGFNDSANLDDGTMWPTAFALPQLTAADEARISALVKKAVS
jgi:uncharacterized protein YdhG (YjbR/CyaY superfamily)